MGTLFPIHRPRIGLSIRAHALDLVEVRRRWRRPPLVRRLLSRPLPEGVVTPSSTAPNLTDPQAFARELRGLCEKVRDRTVAVDVPMACATLGLFQFDTLPASTAEQEALLRWRFRQTEHLVASDLQLVSRLFRTPASQGGAAILSMLSVAMRQAVLTQYHQACEAAGLLPVSMGFSTLHLLDLYGPLMPKGDVSFFAHRTAERLIVLAFRQGRPVFLRVKPLRRTDAVLDAELIRTLQYFDSEHRTPTAAPSSSPLYLVDEVAARLDGARDLAPSSETWTPTADPHWTVVVTRADWGTAPITSRMQAPDPVPFGALAGVLAS